MEVRRRGGDLFEVPAPLLPRHLEERVSGAGKAVVGDEGDGNLGQELVGRSLASQAPLQAKEGVRTGVLPGHDLAVQEELSRGEREGHRDLRKLKGDIVERAREERDARSGLVRVRPDSVELLLDLEAREIRGDFRRIFDRACEHESDRMKETEGDLLQAAVTRGHRGLPDVSAVTPRPRYRLPVPFERSRDGLFDRQDVGAGAQPSRKRLDEVLRFDGGGAPEQLLDRLLFLRGSPQRGERPQSLIYLEDRQLAPALSSFALRASEDGGGRGSG